MEGITLKKRNILGTAIVSLGLLGVMSACSTAKGAQESSDSSAKAEKVATAAIITDGNGVDDKSYNQSAWEGLVKWGEEHHVERGNAGYQYFQSSGEADFVPNIDQAISAGFKTIFGVGYMLTASLKQEAELNPETNFVIVDDLIEGMDNVVSANFESNQAAYLAGVAAAYTTKTDTVGFIGGVESSVITAFEAGYLQGVADAGRELGKEIKVIDQYAGDFGAPDKGKSIAEAMYAQNADVIYAAAGQTGNGLFQEAKAINETGDKEVYVIGVDRDQSPDGNYTLNGETKNFCIASTLKEVGDVLADLAEQANDDQFPGGQSLVYGLAKGGVDLAETGLTSDASKAVDAAREKIIAGNITVQETLK